MNFSGVTSEILLTLLLSFQLIFKPVYENVMHCDAHSVCLSTFLSNDGQNGCKILLKNLHSKWKWWGLIFWVMAFFLAGALKSYLFTGEETERNDKISKPVKQFMMWADFVIMPVIVVAVLYFHNHVLESNTLNTGMQVAWGFGFSAILGCALVVVLWPYWDKLKKMHKSE